ncbi:hypothetical protein ACIA5G_39505 [Amycolatopsis sp. NPDC051758]|uniref:hypothetical protein n=1 Tax=Amycolatopsis sp. NPDC051758 TaxID=3363935 RepID=UPI0037A011BB
MRIPLDVQEKLKTGKQQILAQHGDDPNVTGAGVSLRRRDNKWTDEPVVVVLVAKKRAENLVSRRRLLPKSVNINGENWGVDVVQAGPFRADTLRNDSPDYTRSPVKTALADDPAIKEKMRPARQGSGISNINDGPAVGTLGCYVIDNTDDTVCLLTANHVIGRFNHGLPGEPIIQPGAYDGGTAADQIATLKRSAPLVDGTEVDAAIAQIDDQSAHTDAVARDLMSPIARNHGAVGMVVAGDAMGNCFLTRMDTTITALNVRTTISKPTGPGGGAATGIVAPDIFMNVEKVGRTTGYTSASIVGLHMDIYVDTEHDQGIVRYENCCWTLFFNWAGDSGSIAFAGGTGNLPLFIFIYFLPCIMLSSLESYYSIPLTQDEALSDKLRDDFLAKSLVGRLMISTTYVNSEYVNQRLASMEGKDHATEQSYAKSYYQKYHDFIANVLANPGSSDEVVTEDHLQDIADIIWGLYSYQTFTYEEYACAQNLLAYVLVPTKGMNRQQVIDYLNQTSVYQTVYDLISQVTSIEVVGPISTEHG